MNMAIPLCLLCEGVQFSVVEVRLGGDGQESGISDG